MHKGGRLAVTFRSRQKVKGWGFTRAANIRLYTPEEVCQMLIDAGFQQAQVYHHDQHKMLDSVMILAEA